MKTRIGFHPSHFDTSVRPQDDFFQYAGGGWLKQNPIPDTKRNWGTFYVLRDEGLKKTHSILKELSKKKRLTQGSEQQIVRDFYLSGMNMKLRNKLGMAPVEPTLSKISSLKTKEEMLTFIFKEHHRGSLHVWNPFVGQDDKNAEKYIFHLAQGGLSLPDRDYYLKNDAESVRIREKFLVFVTDLFVLAGTSKKVAREHAQNILDFETTLAKHSMSRVDSRTIEKVYNKMSRSALAALAPHVPWKEYFKTLGIEKHTSSILVLNPSFFKGVSGCIKTVPLETWKLYLYYSELSAAASSLSQPFVDVAFNFYGKVLSGVTKQDPLWKTIAGTLDEIVGQAVGKEYVKKYFPKQAKKEIDALVDNLFIAYEERIKKLTWMSEATKKKALLKLSQITRKIGYPEKWISYRGLAITSDDFFGNIERSNAFHFKKNVRRLGKPVDKKEWFTPPQTVNAFYDPNNNQIVFPAGILQPPFFDPNGDDAINYGAMGSVIGHELTHAFDDEGSKFDGKGNYKNWWTKEDRTRFNKRAHVLVRQFNEFKVGDLHVNGKLTLGENIADLGGLAIGYDAYQLHLQKHKGKKLNGFTPEQRYFIGLSMFETAHARPEYARMLIMVDPHSPAKFRVNGPFSNLEPFYEAWGVTENDTLYRKSKDRAKIW